jgi:hypothetical protein
MVNMTESQKHTAFKETAKRFLLSRGFSEDEIHEEYSVRIELTEMERKDLSWMEADHKWGNHLGPEYEHLRESIQEQRNRAYKRTFQSLSDQMNLVVDVVGISKDKSRKIAIECGNVSPMVRLEILKKEFDEVRNIPPIPFDMIFALDMSEFSEDKQKMT